MRMRLSKSSSHKRIPGVGGWRPLKRTSWLVGLVWKGADFAWLVMSRVIQETPRVETVPKHSVDIGLGFLQGLLKGTLERKFAP